MFSCAMSACWRYSKSVTRLYTKVIEFAKRRQARENPATPSCWDKPQLSTKKRCLKYKGYITLKLLLRYNQTPARRLSDQSEHHRRAPVVQTKSR